MLPSLAQHAELNKFRLAAEQQPKLHPRLLLPACNAEELTSKHGMNGPVEHRWGGLLCGVAALLAAVFLALLGYYMYDRHAMRRARVQLDIEKALVQQVKPHHSSFLCALLQTYT